MGEKSLKKSKTSDGVIVLIYSDDVNMTKVSPIKVDRWLNDLVGPVWVVVDSSDGRLRVFCVSGQASLARLGNVVIKISRLSDLWPRFFRKGLCIVLTLSCHMRSWWRF